MRNKFQCRYPLSKEQFSELWRDSNIVFDTNILLNLYRYSQKTSDSLFSIMETFSNQLWLPYQVGKEFHNNRHSVILGLNTEYDEAKNKISTFKTSFADFTNKLQKDRRIQLADINERIEKEFEDIDKTIEERKEKNNSIFRDDFILNRITKIFNDKVGEDFTTEKISEIERRGEERYKKQIPPGYKDNEKPGTKSYGDLIIWLQLIEYAKLSKKPIIFVTEDGKEDWWRIIKGKTIGPRPELIEEMKELAGVGYYSYTIDNFINYAKKIKELEEPEIEGVIKEIEQVRRKDEEIAVNRGKQQAWQSEARYQKYKDSNRKADPLQEPALVPLYERYRSLDEFEIRISEEYQSILKLISNVELTLKDKIYSDPDDLRLLMEERQRLEMELDVLADQLRMIEMEKGALLKERERVLYINGKIRD